MNVVFFKFDSQFSEQFIADADRENLNRETLEKQFEIVSHETDQSHVQRFWGLAMGNMTLSQFMGREKSTGLLRSHDDRGCGKNESVASQHGEQNYLRFLY